MTRRMNLSRSWNRNVVGPANLRQRPISEGAQVLQGFDKQCAGRSRRSYLATLDHGIGLEGDIDEPSMLERIIMQALVQGFRLVLE
jgi:hypothetical protein